LSVAQSNIPIYIGSLQDVDIENGEYIMMNDSTRTFEINTTNIKLSKGTALKWLSLDIDNKIAYNDAPVTPTDGILDWATDKYAPYTAKKKI